MSTWVRVMKSEMRVTRFFISLTLTLGGGKRGLLFFSVTLVGVSCLPVEDSTRDIEVPLSLGSSDWRTLRPFLRLLLLLLVRAARLEVCWGVSGTGSGTVGGEGAGSSTGFRERLFFRGA